MKFHPSPHALVALAAVAATIAASSTAVETEPVRAVAMAATSATFGAIN